MVSAYKPTYYTSLHDSIASICKTLPPFSFKKLKLKRPSLPGIDHRLSKQQSDNLKWQQDSFHQILNLMGLSKEGMVPESQVSAFRTSLLETLIASPLECEPPPILRDKLLFLQELLYAGCITEVEYHASKRPLLQRLGVQGAEIEARDVIVGGRGRGLGHEEASEEWSCIDLKDEKCAVANAENRRKQKSAVKKIKGAAASASVFVSVLSDKIARAKDYSATNHEGGKFLNMRMSESKSIFAMDSLPSEYHAMAEKQQIHGNGDGEGDTEGKGKAKFGKKAAAAWLHDGLKKLKRNYSDEDEARAEAAASIVGEAESYEGKLVENPIAEGPNTKQIKRKLHPDAAPTDFFIDKVLGDNIKKELLQLQRKYGAQDSNLGLTDDQIEAISTRLPVDKEDLLSIFPKLWCDKYSDIVLDVVRKQFKEHMREMGSHSHNHTQRRGKHQATTLLADENSHPNCFSRTTVNISEGTPRR